MLHSRQKLALQLFKAGYNLFITGNAGSGKSFLIEQMRRLKSHAVITSTTGLSALNVRGITIHRWSGIKADTDLSAPLQFARAVYNKYSTWNNYMFTKILIIDEISMMSIPLLEFLNTVCQQVRGSPEAFGGIQVVFLGDFFQLPPVQDSTESDGRVFAFQSDIWNTIIDFTVVLKKSFRQQNNTLIKALNKIRVGELDSETRAILDAARGGQKDGKIYTHLYANKIKVRAKNTVELNKIDAPVNVSVAKIISKTSKKKECYGFPDKSNIVEKLELKAGCFVMITTNLNIERQLVNGTQGIFEGFVGKTAIVQVNGRRHSIELFTWDFQDYEVVQYPLCLAWAITIHKSQGMGIDYLSIDIGRNIFEAGQAYVALSRAKSLEGLHIKCFDESAIKCSPVVRKFYRFLRREEKKWVEQGPNRFQNILTGRVVSERPSVDAHCQTMSPPEYKAYRKLLQNKKNECAPLSSVFTSNFQMCTLCTEQKCLADYVRFFNEAVCSRCVQDSPHLYRQLSRIDFYKKFSMRFSKTLINAILTRIPFKLNYASNKFRTKTKVYLLKHFLDAMQHR